MQTRHVMDPHHFNKALTRFVNKFPNRTRLHSDIRKIIEEKDPDKMTTLLNTLGATRNKNL